MVQQRGQGPGGRGPINVDVERATVRHADVTRMSVAGDAQGAQEDLLKDIGERLTGRDSLKGSLESIRQAIQDCCVGGPGGGPGPRRTGADKLDQQQEKMARTGEEVVSANKEIVDGLQKLQESLRVLISQQSSLSVTSGEAADNIEKASGAGMAGQKAQEKQYQALEKVLVKIEEQGGKLVIKFADLGEGADNLKGRVNAFRQSLKEARMAEYAKSVNLVIQGLQNFQAELVDVQSNLRKFMEEARRSFQESVNGLTTTTSLLTDQLGNIYDRLIGGVDRDTERMLLDAIRESGEAQARLLAGRSLEKIGEFTRETRDAILGGDDARLRTMFGVQGTNEVTMDTFKFLTRRGIRDDMAMSMSQEMARERMTMMANIVQNTGLTLDAVKALEEKSLEKMESLYHSGAIQTQEQLEFLKNLQTGVLAQDPVLEDLVVQFVKARGELGLLDENTRNMLTALGAQGETQRALELFSRKGGATQEEAVEVMTAIGRRISADARAQGTVSGKILEGLGTQEEHMGAQAAALIGLVDATKDPENKPKGDLIANMISHVNETLEKYVPTALFGLITAVIANTAALYMNTAALLGTGLSPRAMWRGFRGRGGPGGAPRGGPGGVGPRGQRIGPWSGKTPAWTTTPGAAAPAAGRMAGMGGKALGAAKFAGGLAGRAALPISAAMVGKDVIDLATGDVSGENVGAVGGAGLGALIGGGIGFLIGGPPGALLGAGIGMGIGNMGGEAGGAAWDRSQAAQAKAPAVGPSPKTLDNIQERLARQGQMTMQEQNILLGQMLTSMKAIEESNQAAADGITGLRGMRTSTLTPGIKAVAGGTK